MTMPVLKTMKRTTAMLLLAMPASGQEHIHMTVDTFTGMDGPEIEIRAGYLANESAYGFDENGRLTLDGDLTELVTTDEVPSGPFAGAFGAQTIVLTSDFYFSTGRLAGGDFQFEIVGVERVLGETGRVYWVNAIGPGQFMLEADSEGATRDERTYPVGVAGHNHAQLTIVEGEGVYDVTFVAWDANATYADSEPVTVRIRAGDPQPCLADANGDGLVTPADFNAWIIAFNTQAQACDQNGDSLCTPGDFSAWIINYNTGC